MDWGCSLFGGKRYDIQTLPCYFFWRDGFFEENNLVSGQPYSLDVDEQKGSELSGLGGGGPILPYLFHCVVSPVEIGGGEGFGVLPYLLGEDIV